MAATEHRQLVYAGAAPQDVSELSIREIELLQTLKPSNDWRSLPGEDGASWSPSSIRRCRSPSSASRWSAVQRPQAAASDD